MVHQANVLEKIMDKAKTYDFVVSLMLQGPKFNMNDLTRWEDCVSKEEAIGRAVLQAFYQQPDYVVIAVAAIEIKRKTTD